MLAEYGWVEWLSMIASFVLVIGLLVATLFALNKFSPGVSGGHRLKVLEVKNLGARQKLLLVSVNGEQILLGLTPQGMSRLGGWPHDDQSEPDDALLGTPQEQTTNSFTQLFKQTVKRQKD